MYLLLSAFLFCLLVFVVSFVFVVFVCLLVLFEKSLWKPGDPEENHFDPGERKVVKVKF